MTTNDPVLRALSHPTRLRMMSLMWATAQSAAELARALDISQALASHHLRTLHAAGLVELTETRSRRGGAERRYQAIHGAPLTEREQGETLPLLAETMARTLRERAARRAPDGPGVTADVELWLTPQTWDDLRQRMSALLADMHAAAQPPDTEGVVRVGGTAMFFPLSDQPPEPPGAAR
ncbi:MAG: helix-turn-helix domain-containing protein [Streptomycetaceae bacterium]|nr:helix-turn-helix domain-containing protein [Streptomycetaceae bacterium]